MHVEFCRLERPEKARYLCELAEEYYLGGHRVLVLVENDDQGATLDQFMWTWKKCSFLPHACDNGRVACEDEPVAITAREHNVNGADVLIAGAACTLEFSRQFQVVVDFAEVYDETLRDASRQRFKAFREAGFAPVMR